MVTTNPAKPNLLALSSSDSTSASLIVTNYDYDFDYTHKKYLDLSANETVTVAFKNLPFSGSVVVDRYLIDAQTSNLDYWVAAGKLPPIRASHSAAESGDLLGCRYRGHTDSPGKAARPLSSLPLDCSSVNIGRKRSVPSSEVIFEGRETVGFTVSMLFIARSTARRNVCARIGWPGPLKWSGSPV